MKVLSALVGLVSIGATVAQAQVYSLNVVGYVNTPIRQGFNLIANPVNTTNNMLSSVIPSVTENTEVWLYNVGSGYVRSVFQQNDDGSYGWDVDRSVAPGTGFWLNSPIATTVTFVGEVSVGNLTNNIAAGFSLQASKVPQSAALDTALEFVPQENDVVWFFRNGNYERCIYQQNDDGSYSWDKPVVPGVGEGFWVQAVSSKEWVRTFQVQ